MTQYKLFTNKSNLGYEPDVNFTVTILPIQVFPLWPKREQIKITQTEDLSYVAIASNFFQQHSTLIHAIWLLKWLWISKLVSYQFRYRGTPLSTPLTNAKNHYIDCPSQSMMRVPIRSAGNLLYIHGHCHTVQVKKVPSLTDSIECGY